MDENYTDQADGLVDHQSGVDDAAGNVAPILAPADGVITDGPRDGEAVHEGEVIGFVQTEED
jgi:hypothetical protein